MVIYIGLNASNHSGTNPRLGDIVGPFFSFSITLETWTHALPFALMPLTTCMLELRKYNRTNLLYDDHKENHSMLVIIVGSLCTQLFIHRSWHERLFSIFMPLTKVNMVLTDIFYNKKWSYVYSCMRVSTQRNLTLINPSHSYHKHSSLNSQLNFTSFRLVYIFSLVYI